MGMKIAAKYGETRWLHFQSGDDTSELKLQTKDFWKSKAKDVHTASLLRLISI